MYLEYQEFAHAVLSDEPYKIIYILYSIINVRSLYK